MIRRTVCRLLCDFVVLAAVPGLVLIWNPSDALAQKKEKPGGKGGTHGKQERVSGSIQMINKDTSVITLRTKGNIQRYVVYNNETQFTYRNRPGSLDEVKEGLRVICWGKYDKNARLVASRIDVREGK